MLFTRLHMNYFGKFHNYELVLKPGINLVYGENEAGKTTIHTFIRGMLFGIERARGRGAATRDDIYTRYLPWDYPGAYYGQLELQINGRQYRLLRSFHANDKSFSILEVDTGRELILQEGLISELIPGLSESIYRNTISIEQLKARTDEELASQIRNYITNISITKTKEVNVSKALAFLAEQKKSLEASQNNTLIEKLREEIEEGVIKEDKLEELMLRLKALQEEEKGLRAEIDSHEAKVDREMLERIEQLPAILEKYQSYKEMLRQGELLEQKLKLLKQEITVGEKEELNPEAMREELKAAAILDASLAKQTQELSELKAEEGDYRISLGLRVFPMMAVIFAGLTILFLRPEYRIGILIGTAAAGVLQDRIISLRQKHGKEDFEERYNKRQTLISETKEKLQVILDKYGAASSAELSKKQEELIKTSYRLEHSRIQIEELSVRRTEIEDRCDMLLEQIMTYMQFFISEEELEDAAINKLKETIYQRKQLLYGKQAELAKEYNECKLNIEKLRWEIKALEENEEQLIRNREKMQQLEQNNQETNTELEAIRLASDTIQSLSVEIHDSFGRQINSAVSEVIEEVTGHKYDKLKVDESLGVKLDWNGNYIPLDRLSTGTMDQVYLALRLAATDLLLNKEPMPLILDDSFAYYDDNRMKAALQQLAKREQLIIFTCHKRERGLIEELGLDYNYIEL